VGKPSRQCASPGISVQFHGCHAFEEIRQADLFVPLNPLPSPIDFAICLNCGDHSGSRYFDITRFLDNAFQSGTHIALPLCEKAEYMGMPIDRTAVCQPKLLHECSWAAPSNKLSFDLNPLGVGTDRTIPPVAAHAYWFFLGHLSLSPSQLMCYLFSVCSIAGAA
jgi:hypothetical protein